MVKMICETEILPINGFPKRMPLMVGVKNKNCIKQLHFFLSKIRWPQISEEKKRKHAWHLYKNGSKGLVHMYLGQPLSGVHW